MPYISDKQLAQLKEVANALREHIDRGCPFDLTFAPKGDLTPAQQTDLQEYLRYNFKDIWGDTWIKGEAQAIDDIVEWVNTKRIPADGFLAGRINVNTYS